MIRSNMLTSARALVSVLLSATLLLLPNVAFALDITWENPAGDKSIEYLGMIFGNVSTALAGTGGSAIIGNLFNIFNIAVLTLGSLVVGYTIILSALNTAQEGEVMGKKWSSMWIPFRSAMGVALLLPTASGYSLLQIMLMNIVVLGIAAANNLWQQVVINMDSKDSTGVFGKIQMDNDAFDDVTENLLKSMVCAQTYNYTPACQAAIGNQIVSAYTEGDSLKIGVQGDTSRKTLCGSLTTGKEPEQSYSTQTWQGANLSAFAFAANYLTGPSLEIYNGTVSPSFYDIIPTSNNILRGSITAAPKKMGTAAEVTGKYTKAAINNGWIFAGSYYFMIISKNNTLKWNGSEPGSEYAAPDKDGSECQNVLNNAINNISTYTSKTELSAQTGGGGGSLDIASRGGGKAKKVLNELNKPVSKLSYQIIKALTSQHSDPIASMQEIGSLILVAAERMWIAVTVATFIVMIAACPASAFSPTCASVGAMMSVLLPVVIAIVTLLWVAGATMAIYLPLIPYLVFTFTSIGWLILVIEAMAAAPVIALGLVSPSQENLGRASPAVLLITNVFLKPSLMVIGFIIGAKLVRAAVAMLNYGFLATIKASVGTLGLFGSIALIVLYAGILVSVISECFSLIHVLPDKVIRWIGGTPESSGVKEKMAEAKKGFDTGAESASKGMAGSGSMGGKWVSDKRKDNAEMKGKGSGGGATGAS